MLNRKKVWLVGCLVSALVLSGCSVGNGLFGKGNSGRNNAPTILPAVEDKAIGNSSDDLDKEVEDIDKELDSSGSGAIDWNGLNETKIIDGR